jgi:predicted HD phosphohydrolase
MVAEAAGAAPALVAAALLHDVGHLTGGDDARYGQAGTSRSYCAACCDVRDSALTAIEFRTLNATAPPR